MLYTSITFSVHLQIYQNYDKSEVIVAVKTNQKRMRPKYFKQNNILNL